MWAVLSAILPWSTFALAGALVYFIRKASRWEAKYHDKDVQARDLGGRVSSLKAENGDLRSRLQAMRDEYQRTATRLMEAQQRAGEIQARASEVARQMAVSGGATDENYRRLMRLLDS